jgi:hypothetical protein
MANDNNGVIYLEVDEDITSAVDKLAKSSSETVQIVTAKRSTLFQSVINLRLLKKAADDAGKELVLVTSDRVSTNLAGRIGVPVATQVGGHAHVPKPMAATAIAADDEIDGGTIDDDEGEDADAADTVGQYEEAGSADEPEEEPEPVRPPRRAAPTAAGVASGAAAAAAADGPGKGKPKSMVPNISKMQKRVLWIGGGVLAILLLVALNYYFTSAKVTLFAKGSQKTASFNLTADPSVQQSSPSEGVLAATEVNETKTLNASVTGTGQKDNGTKAGGTITVSNSYDANSHPLVAGTRFVSGDGKVFRSTQDASVPGATPTIKNGHLGLSPGTVQIPVQADQNGDQYNLGPTSYTIPGLPPDQQSQITGSGSQMQGGTSKISKIITQSDIDKAQQTALDSKTDDAQKELLGKAGSGQAVLKSSFQQKVTKVDANPEVNSEASNGTVVVQVSYSALVVKKSELSDLVKAQEQAQVGPDQEIYSDGSDNLDLVLQGQPDASGAMKFAAKSMASIGKKIDKAQLASDLKGKKLGEAEDIAARQQDVDKADIKLSPSWATSMPNVIKHIHIEVTVSDQ